MKELKTYHEKINKLSIDSEKGDGRRRTWSYGKSPLVKDSKRITAEWNNRIVEENGDKNGEINDEMYIIYLRKLINKYFSLNRLIVNPNLNECLADDAEIKKEEESQKLTTVHAEISKDFFIIQKDQETEQLENVEYSKNDSKDKTEENASETTQIKESPAKSSPNFLEFLQKKSGEPTPTINKLNFEDESGSKDENILTESLKESNIEEKNSSENNNEEPSTSPSETIFISKPSMKINYNIVINATEDFSPNKAVYEFVTCEAQEETKQIPIIENRKPEEIMITNESHTKKLIHEELNNLYSKLVLVPRNDETAQSQKDDSKKVIIEELNSLYYKTSINYVNLEKEKEIKKEVESCKKEEIDFKSKKIIAEELTGLYSKITHQAHEMENAEALRKKVVAEELDKSQTKVILQELNLLIESICKKEGSEKKEDNAKIIETINLEQRVDIDPTLTEHKTQNNPPKEEKKTDSIRNKSHLIQKKPIRVEKKKKEEPKTSETKPKKENKEKNNMLFHSARLPKEEKQAYFEFKSSPLKKSIPNEKNKNPQPSNRSISKEKQTIEQKPLKQEKKPPNIKKTEVIEKSKPERKIVPKTEKKIDIKKMDSKPKKTEKCIFFVLFFN